MIHPEALQGFCHEILRLRFASRGMTVASMGVPVLPVLRVAVLALIAGLLAGCANAPRALDGGDWNRQLEKLAALEQWQLRGRVNVRYDNESHTLRILWRQQKRNYNIRLWGSFNAGNTLITGGPEGVSLESDGEVLTAATPENLILEQLGYELPVSRLEYWVRGLPAPTGDVELDFNDANQLRTLRQDGWSVQYDDPRQYGELSLPGAIDLSRAADDIRLRLLGLRWIVGPAE